MFQRSQFLRKKVPVKPGLLEGNPAPVAVTVLPRRLVAGSKVKVRCGMVNVVEALTLLSSVTNTVMLPADKDALVTGITAVVARVPLVSRSIG